MCVTDRHDMTLAVKVTLHPNATNQAEFTEQNRIKNFIHTIVLNTKKGLEGFFTLMQYFQMCSASKCRKKSYSYNVPVLTLYQTTKFQLVQIESICRRTIELLLKTVNLSFIG